MSDDALLNPHKPPPLARPYRLRDLIELPPDMRPGHQERQRQAQHDLTDRLARSDGQDVQRDEYAGHSQQPGCRTITSIRRPNAPDMAVICHSMNAEMPSTVAAPFPPLNFSAGVKL